MAVIDSMPLVAAGAASPQEAARVLGVSRDTIYRLIDRGELSAFHVGRAVRIPRAALEALAEREEEGAAA